MTRDQHDVAAAPGRGDGPAADRADAADPADGAEAVPGARPDDADPAAAGEVLGNEFAVVRVRTLQGRRAGIEIEDVKTGQRTVLGPLELECLAYARQRDLFALLDPSATRWRADAEIDGSARLL